MNIKKFVSAVSALAIAGSVFAGWAVTASAAGYTRTLSDELTISGYKAGTFYDFQTNTPEVLPTSGDLRYRDGGVWGLHNYGSGNRTATANIPVNESDLLVLQSYKAEYIPTINCGTKNDTLSDAAGYFVYDITADSDTVTFTVPRYGGIVAALVMNEDASAETAQYTVNYVCDNVTIKTSTTSGVVGSAPILDKADFYSDDGQTKYSYASDNSAGVTIAADGSTVITVQVNAFAKYAYSVKAMDGTNEIKELSNGSDFSGTKVSYSYPKYITGENHAVTYICNEEEYTKTAELTGNAEYTASYSAYTGSAIYFIDSNEMTANYAQTESQASLSNGSASRLGANASAETGWKAPATGAYKVTMYARNQRSAAETVSLDLAEKAADNTITSIGNTAEWSSPASAYTTGTVEVNVTEGSELVIRNATDYNSNIFIDYVLIEPVPAVPNFTVDLGAAIVANGTNDYADTVATGYIATVTNDGANGSTTKINVTAKGKTLSENIALTLDKGAAASIALILNNVGADDTVSATIE